MDRELVWALVVVLNPLWVRSGCLGVCWASFDHWKRLRDVTHNEVARFEALLFITFVV